MSKVKTIPTSKLVFETVYPGHVEIKSRIGAEEELFLRLTKEYKLTPEMVRKFVKEEQEKISARGDDLGSYFFDGDRTLDSSLIALYTGIDHIGRTVSSINNLTEFTFSEYAYFQAITSTLWVNYGKRKKAFGKRIEKESDNINKMLSSDSLFADKEVAIEAATMKRDELIGRRNRESELEGLYHMISNLCLTKGLEALDVDKRDARAVLRLLRELLRVYTGRKSQVSDELKGYLDINKDFYQHDIDLLDQAGASGYRFTKK